MHFFQVYWFICIESFVVISDGGLYFCGICGDIPFIIFYCIYLIILFSFLLIWLVVYFVDLFKKTSSWIYWAFEGFFFVCFSFSSALILVISYLPLGFEFFKSCSSSSFHFDNRVLILDLSLLLMWALIAIYFPLDTALNVSQRFWYVVIIISMHVNV